MEDINDELLRAAEIEEALMSGVAPGSNINYGSSMPFSSPKLGYSDPPQTLASMTAPQSFTTQYPQQGTQRDALGTQQAAMPYFGTIAAPNQATQGYQPQAQSQRHMQQPLPGSTPSMMPSNYQQNNPMMGNPAPGQRIPTAIVNGVPVFSDNATVSRIPATGHLALGSTSALCTPHGAPSKECQCQCIVGPRLPRFGLSLSSPPRIHLPAAFRATGS